LKGWGRIMIIWARIETEPNYAVIQLVSLRKKQMAGQWTADGELEDIREKHPSETHELPRR
jgi:type IV secretory pathway VirB10-like protein